LYYSHGSKAHRPDIVKLNSIWTTTTKISIKSKKKQCGLLLAIPIVLTIFKY